MRRILATVAIMVVASAGMVATTAAPALAATPTCNNTVLVNTNSAGYVPLPSASGSTTCNMVQGAYGNAVRNLQIMLNHCYSNVIGAQLAVDNDFGGNTYNALKKAQTYAGTTSDGQYGPNTRNAFNNKTGWFAGIYSTPSDHTCIWVIL